MKQEDLQYSKLIKNMKTKKENSWDFSLDPHGLLLWEKKHYGKVFTALIAPKPLQKYVLYESHTSLGHNGMTRLYQFLRRQCFWTVIIEICLTVSTVSNKKLPNTKLCFESSPVTNSFHFNGLDGPIWGDIQRKSICPHSNMHDNTLCYVHPFGR